MANDILIVDDESDIRKLIAGILQDEGYETREAGNSADAFDAIRQRQPNLIILDVWLQASDHDGLQMLDIIRRDQPNQQVIMISGHATFDMAVSATKIGAYDFLTKPFKTDVLLNTVDRAIDDARLRRENRELQELTGGDIEELVGTSGAAGQLRQMLAKVAPTDSRVLITGPPGAGKGVFARLLHKKSARRDGPFVELNCAGLEPEGLEPALFGTEATEAAPRTIGVLERAHKGTLLLDEVADMPAETQGRIVRVLHKPHFQRIGGSDMVDVDVRVIATSNRDLEAEIESGRFREDLFYRLAVVPVQTPSLAERREDIPELAVQIMERSASAKRRQPREFSKESLAALQAHDWPGNIWELVNVVERLLLLGGGVADEAIPGDAVAQAIGLGSAETLVGSDRAMEVMNQPLRMAREDFEKDYLTFHLTRFGGNISRTAEFVGMDRAALHRKLKLLGVQNSVRMQKADN